ncbi:protein FAM131C [Dromiciops gliroides]|uniref:protein FAM131C n=1 Tax=Dromiciops gliroides TaxID=33562 RepID=UPI001CC7AA96|nr:protein FAM131C [Dromiciops gliroides]
MGSCVSRELFTSAHKDCPLPRDLDCPAPGLPSSCLPQAAPDHATNKEKQMDFCWDPWQKCFRTPNGFLSESKTCSSNYNVAALATSSLVGVVQSIKDHITKPTAMARGRVAHLIEWKGWSAQQSGWDPSPAEEEHYSYLPDELREARFAAGVAEQFAITEATLSAWSSIEDEEMCPGENSQDVIPLQDLGSIYLQDNLLNGPILDGSLQGFSSLSSSLPAPGLPAESWDSPEEPSTGRPWPPSPEKQGLLLQGEAEAGEGQTPTEPRSQLHGSLHYVDSSSLSEDEVFYN